MTALAVEGVSRNFGALAALSDVSFGIEPGERRAIIGPNGAGKTTLFDLISGELPPSRGRIRLDGRDVTRSRPNQRAQLGLARTFQRNNLCPGLTVLENVRLAVQRHAASPLVRCTVGSVLPWVARRAGAVLEQVGLSDYPQVAARHLSYGAQRQLEVAIALATEPRVLLLDEPSAGMSPAETSRIAELIAGLPRTITILIIEHDMDVVFALADRITVLHYGTVLTEGTPTEVRANPRVREVYLGSLASKEA